MISEALTQARWFLCDGISPRRDGKFNHSCLAVCQAAAAAGIAHEAIDQCAISAGSIYLEVLK